MQNGGASPRRPLNAREKKFLRDLYDQAREAALAKGIDAAGARRLALSTAALLGTRGLDRQLSAEEVARAVGPG
ncbi:hypothetical protein [Arenibaculum pallidiluteum]|uniref:hypothetical protein n=1 Tax=Arenibaculum pallidiluteum TaxID=2812559 RepID=UPI001A95717D|nr:hypothetical protein [Arenibaculum pallidiluteum]